MIEQELLSLEALLQGYRAEGLRIMRDVNKLDPRVKQKADLVEVLTALFKTPTHIQSAVTQLDPAAKAMLTQLQRAGGRAAHDGLRGILSAEGAVSDAALKTDRYGRLTTPRGDPSQLNSTRFEDVLARLEARGLVLGSSPLDTSSSVVDLGLAYTLFIPSEVLPHLPPVPADHPPEVVEIEEEYRGDTVQFSRELYIVWSYIWQNTPSLLKSSGTLAKRDLKALLGQLPLLEGADSYKREDDLPRLFFQRALLGSLNLVQQHDLTLTVDRAKSEAYWTKPLAERAKSWLESWRAADWWNELPKLSGVNWWSSNYEDRYGAPNQVVQARSHLLTRIGKAGAKGGWVSLPEFLRLLRTQARDFLIRPNKRQAGVYGTSNAHRYTAYTNADTWSFEGITSEELGWTRVESQFVSLVLQVLHWFGCVDLGGPSGSEKRIEAFRLTPMGLHLLAEGPPPEEVTAEGSRVVVQPNFRIMAFGPVGEGTLMELERFADRLKADRALEFELTRSSFYRGQRTGLEASAILTRLRELTGADLPQNVVRTLEEWQAAHERIVIRKGISLLQVADPELLATIQARGAEAVRAITPTVALIQDADRLKQVLTEVELVPVQTHDAKGTNGVLIDEAGYVSFRHQVPDIYLVGRVQQLAEWDGERQQWRLTAAAAARARDAFGLQATAQLDAWRELLATAPPEWLEQRVKAWTGYYGNATLHRVVLIELRDDKAWDELRRDATLKKRLKRFKPHGPLLAVRADQLDEVRALLEAYGVSLNDERS